MGLSQLPAIVPAADGGGPRPGHPPPPWSPGAAPPHPAAVRAPLEQLPEAAKRAGVQPPAVIVVGETAALDLSPTIPRPLDGVSSGSDRDARHPGPPAPSPAGSGGPPLLPDDHSGGGAGDKLRLGAACPGPQTGWCSPARTGWSASSGPWIGANVDLRTLASCRFAVIGPRHGSRPSAAAGSPPTCARRSTPPRGWRTPCWSGSPPVSQCACSAPSWAPGELYRRLAERFPAEDVPLYALRPDNMDPAALQARLEGGGLPSSSPARSGVDFLLDSGVTLPPDLTCVCIGPVTARALGRSEPCPLPHRTGHLLPKRGADRLGPPHAPPIGSKKASHAPCWSMGCFFCHRGQNHYAAENQEDPQHLSPRQPLSQKAVGEEQRPHIGDGGQGIDDGVLPHIQQHDIQQSTHPIETSAQIELGGCGAERPVPGFSPRPV